MKPGDDDPRRLELAESSFQALLHVYIHPRRTTGDCGEL